MKHGNIKNIIDKYRGYEDKKLMGYKQYDEKTLKKIQQYELEVIKEFVRVCNKYEIKYWAGFGTALGAIRHQGFIPWDDDVDFCMLREDYERFLKVAEKEFDGKYALAGPDCPQKFYNFVSKMYKKGTVFSTIYNHGNFEMGINIDIFVYDYIASEQNARRKQINTSLLLRQIYMLKNVNFFKSCVLREGKTLMRVVSAAVHYLLKIIPLSNEKICRLWKKNAMKFYQQSEIVSQLNDTMIWESRMKLNDIFPLKEVPFEDMLINVPKDYEKHLSQTYGDYMELPPLEKRQNHFPYILDFGEETAE